MVKVQEIEEPGLLRNFMRRDPRQMAYALGDLDPVHWELSRFYGAFDSANTLHALLLIYTGFSLPVLTAYGNNEGVAALLQEVALPEEVLCLLPDPLLNEVDSYYLTQHTYALWRMAVDGGSFRPRQRAFEGRLRRLSAADVEALNAFYRLDLAPGEEVIAFSPRQIENGLFMAIEQGGKLVAAAGTHVMSVAEDVAAVGNILVAPDLRGQGLGTVVTQAVTAALLEAGINTVVLNVKQTNHPAIRVYEKLGYTRVGAFVEGYAHLRSH